MIWTLLAFGITLYLLNKLAFPRIAEALDRRRKAIEESIESAQRAKQEADELLEEYRARLREAREQAEDIVARARKAAENAPGRDEGARPRSSARSCSRRRGATSSTRPAARSRRSARRSPTSRSLATEKVTRKSLDDGGPPPPDRGGARRRSTSPSWRRRRRKGTATRAWRRSPRSTPARCSRSRRSTTCSTASTTSWASSPTRSTRTATLQVFLFSPYFSSEEKREGVRKIVSDADERFVNFLELLAERHRMPALFRIRREFDALWAEENKLLPVTVTSAVELDEGARRGHRQAHPGADRPEGGAVLERRPRRARRSDGPRREHGPRRDRPQQT